MATPATRDRIQSGISACRLGQFGRATALFEAAASELGAREGLPPRALAWYGLAVASSDRKGMSRAIALCEAATSREFFDSELYLVLARVYQLAGWRKKAVDAVAAGLRISPDDGPLLELRAVLGVRARPALRFLSRDHPVNIALGRMRRAIRPQR